MRLLLAVALTIASALTAEAQMTVACGVAPVPAAGCKVGPCVCDQNGNNCHYIFICD
jgi:hypothetical protein